ncbi:MAG: NERD domain-containing protein [Anaerolineales bacterium]
MKLIEPTQKTVQKDRFEKYLDQIKQMLLFGKPEEQGDDAIVARFMRGLDNRFIMLHNLHLEGPGVLFPPILIGPPGLIVLNVNHEKGFFRAKDESWWEMSKTTHRFGPARPNLIKQSQAYAQKLAEILDAHGKSHPEILPILIFADPGVHIETSNPVIRIVRMDGVESLIASFLNSEEVLQPNEISYLSDSLEVMANPEKAIPLGEGEDFFGRDLLVPEKKAPPKLPSFPSPTDLSLPPVEDKLKFNKKQWIILALLLSLTIVVLLGAIVYALSMVRP